MKRLFFPILALLLGASTLLAADAPHGPNPKLSELNYFVGSWQCTGTGFAFMGMPEHKTTATVEVAHALNDYWLTTRYTENKTAANPHPVDVRIFWGFDEQMKKFAAGSVDDTGAYDIEYSSGWVGDKLTFEGDMHGGGTTMKIRESFTKSSAKKLEHLAEVEMSGKWSRLDEETCSKK